MNTNRALLNAKQINSLTGLEAGLLKYHRNQKHIRGYRVEGEREWLYRIDQINRLFAEFLNNSRQKPVELAIIKSNSSSEEGNS